MFRGHPESIPRALTGEYLLPQDAIFNICFVSKRLGFVNISFLSAEDLEFGGRNMKPVSLSDKAICGCLPIF